MRDFIDDWITRSGELGYGKDEGHNYEGA